VPSKRHDEILKALYVLLKRNVFGFTSFSVSADEPFICGIWSEARKRSMDGLST
jgi:hypothetical protein